MRQQLIQYVTLLFAGTSGCDEIKQEILQNTLDRYDDLIAQGKAPEAAYRLAISGIGDISEILGALPVEQCAHPNEDPKPDPSTNKFLRAAAIGLYILSPIPLFVLSEFKMETLGLCGTLVFIAIATFIFLLFKKKDSTVDSGKSIPEPSSPQSELRKGINSLIWIIGLVSYFLVSFSTQAWFITWVIFPMIGAVQGLVRACFDLKEAM